VYVDGGHSRWLTPDQLADRLRAVGVERARGFALNTSNFFSTDEEIGYGEAVSRLLNGAHYVVDTLIELPAVLDAIEARLANGERP